MRVGCGSATVGIFAKQFFGQADEVVVVDDHITGVLTEHQAGRCLDMRPSGIKIRGRKSTPGRYFQVANPGTGWGGTDIADPLSIIEGWDAERGLAGPAAADGVDHRRARAWYVLDEQLRAASSSRCPPTVQPRRRAHRRELRALAVHGAVPRRRRRQPARRRHRKPGAADARDQAGAGQRDLRRRAGLRVAGRRHHRDGRRDAHARQQLRHRAHAGDRRADRVQHAAATTTRRSAATWSTCARSTRCCAAAPGTTTARRRRGAGCASDAANPWPLGQPPDARLTAHDAPTRTARRTAAGTSSTARSTS